MNPNVVDSYYSSFQLWRQRRSRQSKRDSQTWVVLHCWWLEETRWLTLYELGASGAHLQHIMLARVEALFMYPEFSCFLRPFIRTTEVKFTNEL